MVFCEAELTLFAFFFWKKKKTTTTNSFLGPAPDPRVGFAEIRVKCGLLRSRTNAFCFFFWKKKKTTTTNSFLGPYPDPVTPLRGGLGESLSDNN
jgi:hypothetical protein